MNIMQKTRCVLYIRYLRFYYTPIQEEFEDTKGVIRIRISKKNRQHNGQKEKGQRDKQRSTKYTHKTKDRVARTPLKVKFT